MKTSLRLHPLVTNTVNDVSIMYALVIIICKAINQYEQNKLSTQYTCKYCIKMLTKTPVYVHPTQFPCQFPCPFQHPEQAV